MLPNISLLGALRAAERKIVLFCLGRKRNSVVSIKSGEKEQRKEKKSNQLFLFFTFSRHTCCAEKKKKDEVSNDDAEYTHLYIHREGCSRSFLLSKLIRLR
jgi:hypothetical protein